MHVQMYVFMCECKDAFNVKSCNVMSCTVMSDYAMLCITEAEHKRFCTALNKVGNFTLAQLQTVDALTLVYVWVGQLRGGGGRIGCVWRDGNRA